MRKVTLLNLLVFYCFVSNIIGQDKSEINSKYSSSISMQDDYSPEKGEAIVYFVRLNGGKIALFHKDKYIGEVNSKEYLRYSCPAGEQLFWASSENKEFLTADLKEGCCYVVLVRPVKFSGFWKVHVELLPLTVDNKEYFPKSKKLINKGKPNNKSDIKKMNVKLEGFINVNLTKYEKEWKNIRHFKHISADMCMQINDIVE